MLFIVAVAGVCRVADFGDIELLEGNYESRLVNDRCQVYSCEVRGKTYTDIKMTLVKPTVQGSL